MYRQVDTGTWDDPWFAELDPDAKLLFLYLLTNRRSTAAGVFEITARAMSFETGMDAKRVSAALSGVSSRVQWWPEHQVVWVRNFLRHQAVSPKFYMSAWNEMREMPDEIRVSVGQVYPILTRDEKPPEKKEDIETLLIPYPKGIDTVSEPSRKTSTRSRTRPVKASSLEGGADAPTSTPSTPQTDTPYALLEALCETQGQDASVFPKREKDKQLGVAKRLTADGMTAGDVATMTKWLMSQNWVTSGVDMFLIEKQVGKWNMAGRPAAASKANGRNQPEDPFDVIERELQGAPPENVIDARFRRTS